MKDALTDRRFLGGLLLAWVPWIPIVIWMGYFISTSKATGLAALIGSLVELLVWWGIAAVFISQIAAIIWLIRSISSANILRSLMASVSMIACAMTLFLVGAFLIWGRRLMEQFSGR